MLEQERVRVEHRSLSAKLCEISLFREFVREKKYRTEAEVFGWSFVFEDLVSDELRNKATQKMQVREPRVAPGLMGVGPGPRTLWGLGGHLGHSRDSNLRTTGREEARETHPGRPDEHTLPGRSLCAEVRIERPCKDADDTQGSGYSLDQPENPWRSLLLIRVVRCQTLKILNTGASLVAQW